MVEPIDRFPQGDPDTVVPLPHGETIVGLAIRGVEHAIVLGVREDDLGRPVSCAVTNALLLGVNVENNEQSNPRRIVDHGEQ